MGSWPRFWTRLIPRFSGGWGGRRGRRARGPAPPVGQHQQVRGRNPEVELLVGEVPFDQRGAGDVMASAAQRLRPRKVLGGGVANGADDEQAAAPGGCKR